MGHSAVLAGVNITLSKKWVTIWKWDRGLYLGVLGAFFLVLIFPILGLLAMFGAVIAIGVVSVLKAVYLYRTAKTFREYSGGTL